MDVMADVGVTGQVANNCTYDTRCLRGVVTKREVYKSACVFDNGNLVGFETCSMPSIFPGTYFNTMEETSDGSIAAHKVST